MSKTDDAPFELFKQALATTAKAMSQTRDVEVTFSGDGPRAEADRIVLPPPPRDLSPEQAAQARGDADATALRMAHHDPLAHSKHRPQSEVGRQVYEAAERARIESIGARAMDGTANNLDAVLADRCEKAGYSRMEDRQEAPLAPAVRAKASIAASHLMAQTSPDQDRLQRPGARAHPRIAVASHPSGQTFHR